MIPLEDIYNKGINLLIGSGASYGLFPTLELAIKKDTGERWTLEELATHFEATEDPRHIPLFMHYYKECILPAQHLSIATVTHEPGKTVIANYKAFLQTLLALVQRRQALDRRCNLFTTNYDGCIPLVADSLLRVGAHDFVLNDGTRGFQTKILEARNFNNYLCQSGVFDRHVSSVPQINLIHLHGSVYWKKSLRAIEVDYRTRATALLDEPTIEEMRCFSAALGDPNVRLEEIPTPKIDETIQAAFWSEYKQMPIVNPTKWKFHETVYEEHYYQMLRLLSYELEKPNAVLITFGFSFADEHILHLVKRSLSNPRLMVFVCCFNTMAYDSLSEEFRQYSNVKCLVLEAGAEMTFSEFNGKVFTLRDQRADTDEAATVLTGATTPKTEPSEAESK